LSVFNAGDDGMQFELTGRRGHVCAASMADQLVPILNNRVFVDWPLDIDHDHMEPTRQVPANRTQQRPDDFPQRNCHLNSLSFNFAFMAAIAARADVADARPCVGTPPKLKIASNDPVCGLARFCAGFEMLNVPSSIFRRIPAK